MDIDFDTSKVEPSERLRNILDKRSGLVITKDDMVDGSELPSKTIAEIKTKIQINKRGRITDTDVISAARTSEINTNSFERVWRTRESILQSQATNFKIVLDYLEVIKKKEAGVYPSRQEGMITNKNKKKEEELYSRYDQSRQDNTGSFQIDTLGSNTANTLSSLVSGTKRPHKKEEPTILASPATQSPPAKKKSRTPIIIVPSAAQSIITLANARNLLEGYKYVSHEEAKRAQSRVESEVLVQYKGSGRTLPFKIINNISKLHADDWERVVAVFVHGPAWQFKGWPIMENNDPNSIFQKVLAFHLKWTNKPVEGNVRKWSCNVVELDAIKRHADSQKFRQLWQKIETYCKRDRPNLRIF